MKKLLLIPLAILILITFLASAPPPVQIVVRGEEGLAELREIVEADDEKLREYARRHEHYRGQHVTREMLINLLTLFDSLPLPSTSEIRLNGISYFPHWNSIDVSFRTDIGELYNFQLSGRGKIETWEFLFELDMNFEDLVKVYSDMNSRDFIMTRYGNINFIFIIDIDNFVFRITYYPGDYPGEKSLIRSVNPEEIFEFLYGVSPWVYVPEPFTTEEALIILQAVAGTIELSDEQSARFGIENAPTSADALRILRAVAGL
ncbi:MAG: hypothetical protein FWD48_00785 [Oscillospiraceae bacterium]|nr:hypothetical protein [Oscillospiraceae bacterium]